MNNSSVLPKDFVQEINDETALLFVPSTVIFCILMITGLVGNLMVFFFYGFKSKRNPTSIVIAVLAIYDLIICTVSMPHDIVYCLHFYTYSNKHACKSVKFICYFTVIASGFTLIVIAVDRYKHICASGKYNVTVKDILKQCAFVAALSLFITWPIIILYDIVAMPLPMEYGSSLSGTSCSRMKSLRIYTFALDVLYLIIFFLCMTILVVLYFKIIKVLYIHRQNFGKSETILSGKHSKRIDRMTTMITIAMIVITSVFFISFMPRLCLLVWRSIEGVREDQFLSGAGLLWFQIGRQSYMLNSSLNPWIYGIFNSQFRQFYYKKLCRHSRDPIASTDTTRETIEESINVEQTD